MIIPRKIVSVILDPDSDEEPIYFTYDIDGKFTKIRDLDEVLGITHSKPSKDEPIRRVKEAIDRFFQLDLPYIAYHDVNPFELLDDECDVLNTKIFLNCDGMLERDRFIGNEVGLKTKRERVERPVDHHYLPGKPDLIYESYPFFQPNKNSSIELTNEQYYEKFVLKFEKQLRKSFKTKEGKEKLKNTLFQDYFSDLATFQTPVDYPNYFTILEREFYDLFKDRIFQPILDLYSNFLLSPQNKLKEYFLEADKSYSPSVNTAYNVPLKAIGSVGSSSFPFGISDVDTGLLNALLVHVEIVNLSLGIGEGYELYFNSAKQNFERKDGIYNKLRVEGPDSTKIDNFLKYFTKCVSICLNSHTNRFIMTDYYWVGVFQIEDIEDGEIYDVRKLISKVNVVHYSYSNFESEESVGADIKGLTIRSIIASWLNISSSEFVSTNEKFHNINKRVIKEWELFKKSNSFNNLQNNKAGNGNKRLKLSPFQYTTPSGLNFVKQKVDLEKSLISFIAIGYFWTSQTLCVDLKHLFSDKQHYFRILNENKLNNTSKRVLLSIYDQQFNTAHFQFSEYYRDDKKLITSRHNGMDSLFNFIPLKELNSADETYRRWDTNVEIYSKLKPLQGDVIAKVLNFGYLEDKTYNDSQLHFKADGYYIIYEPITTAYFDLKPLDIDNEEHYRLAKESLNKIHEHGVTFQPNTSITLQILKIYEDKVYIINLEDASIHKTKTPSSGFKSFKSKDLTDLDIIFKKAKPRGRIMSNNNNSMGMNGQMSKHSKHHSGSRKSSSSNHMRARRSINDIIMQSVGPNNPLRLHGSGTLLDEDDIEDEALFSEDEQ